MNTLMFKNRWVWLMPLLLVALSAQVSARALPNFVDLVDENSPSVVNISTKQKNSGSNGLRREYQIPQFPEGSPFNKFFEDFEKFFGDQYNQRPKEYESKSLGSGFIISEDGYVLTNYHVVTGADEIIVKLSDQREYLAKVIGSDKKSDVALLKIDAKDLPKVKIGSTNNLKVGEWVLAIGSPFGFDHTVTAGIVSAKGRNLPSENYVPFIQTDVAINPGNSGGPLFNLKGEVVGINSQIYSRTGGFMGLSFAIPIEMAMSVADQLKENGRVSRGWLGVLIQDLNRDLAESFGLKHPKGALVAKVVPDSPAANAGLQAGDVILSYNGKALHDSSMLPPLVGSSRVGKPADLEILRGGKKKTISVTIGELPDDDEAEIASAEPSKSEKSSGILGLEVAAIDSDLKQRLGLDSDKGVLVQTVHSGPAETAGITEGDVIQMINNHRVDTVADFKQAVEDLPRGRTIAVLVIRSSGPRFLTIRIPE